MPRKIIPFPLRLPAPIYEVVKRVSESERRSMNNQILIWLERGMPDGITDEARADIAVAAEASR